MDTINKMDGCMRIARAAYYTTDVSISFHTSDLDDLVNVGLWVDGESKWHGAGKGLDSLGELIDHLRAFLIDRVDRQQKAIALALKK